MAPRSAPKETWKLRLFGRFSLTNPAGETVRLPDRKTEGLLAILVLNRKLGMARQDAANILWPDRLPSNLANLRQALSVLRRALGTKAIESSEAHCRLSSEFHLVSDYEDISSRGDGGFMPGHEGEWFDEIRLESLEAGSDVPSVVEHYLNSLRWFAAHDPQSMYAVLSATPAMARSIPYQELGPLLEQTRNSNPPPGWHAFWLGTVKRDLDECKRLLRFALKQAREERDLALASEVCVELGRAYSRTGDPDRASKICDIADDIAHQTGKKSQRKNALRLRGTVQMYWHEPEEGHKLLTATESEIDCPIELTSLMHLRAFLEASMGWFEKAAATQKQAEKIDREGGHFRTGILSTTTTAFLKAAQGSKTEAIHDLETLAAQFYENEASQFGVYAEELAAKLHYLNGDKAAAKRALLSAKKERVKSHMAVTPLEARRVAILR